MIPILFFILKIIGILLLVLLGVFLFLLLSVLLVPVRYRGEGSWYGKPEGDFKCSWFLHLVSVSIRYRGEPEIRFRLFGIHLFKEKGRRAKEDLEEAADDVLKDGETVLVQEAEETPAGRAAFGNGREWTADSAALRDPREEAGGDLILSSQELGTGEQLEESGGVRGEAEDLRGETENPGGEAEDLRGEAEGSRGEAEGPGGEAEGYTEQTAESGSGPEDKANPKTNGRGPFGRLRSWLSRWNLRFRIAFKRAKAFFIELCRKGKQAAEIKQAAVEFLADEENKKTIKLIKRELFKVLRHLRPTRLEGRVTFGLSDPYAMGQLLTAAAFLYPLYGARLSLTPDFEQTILEGELAVRGRIRLGTLLAAAVRILLNKNFRRQLKKFLNRGGNEHGR